MASYAVFCTGNHKMNHTQNYKPNLYCNSCHQYPSHSNTGYYECRTCNYDICDKCYEQKKQMICAQGHKCQSYAAGTATDSHVCYRCHKVPSQNRVEYFVCEQCPNYTCMTCAMEVGMAMMQNAMGMFGNMATANNPNQMFGGMMGGFGNMMGAMQPKPF
ncbi:hypothetical protein ABPG74_015356 [Tetrahymena malaccensis]